MQPDDLRLTLFRLREARALLAGHELGVFEALGCKERSPCDLAAELHLDAEALGVLLDALVASGALRRVRGCYALTSEASALFLRASDSYVGHLLLHDLWHWSSWARLDETIRSGAPVTDRAGDPHLGRSAIVAQFLPNYVRAMEETSREGVGLLAARIASLRPDRITDLGGGSGSLLRAVLARLPEARGCLVEHGFSIDRARELAAADPNRARLELRAADIEKDELPGQQSLVMLSRVLMGLSRERAAALVRRAVECLCSDGLMLIHDYAPRSRVGALLSLDMRLHCGSQVHSAREIRRFLRRAGCDLIETVPILPYTQLFVARRRRELALAGASD